MISRLLQDRAVDVVSVVAIRHRGCQLHTFQEVTRVEMRAPDEIDPADIDGYLDTVNYT